MRFITLQSKDVVSAHTGAKIGYVVDMEIDPICHCIPIENIITIGEDVIIVNVEC